MTQFNQFETLNSSQICRSGVEDFFLWIHLASLTVTDIIGSVNRAYRFSPFSLHYRMLSTLFTWWQLIHLSHIKLGKETFSPLIRHMPHHISSLREPTLAEGNWFVLILYHWYSMCWKQKQMNIRCKAALRLWFKAWTFTRKGIPHNNISAF